MKSKKEDQSVNFDENFTVNFVQYYNDNIPKGFPKASQKALEEFQRTHPSLFKENEKWTIDKHRKKLMDWLVSYKDPAKK